MKRDYGCVGDVMRNGGRRKKNIKQMTQLFTEDKELQLKRSRKCAHFISVTKQQKNFVEPLQLAQLHGALP